MSSSIARPVPRGRGSRRRADTVATTRRARLADIALPAFGMPESEPAIPPDVHAARLERLREAMAARRYDRLVVYASREHGANLAWRTGFEARFEEAIAVVGTVGEPAILVGNECYGTAGAAPLPMLRALVQERLAGAADECAADCCPAPRRPKSV